MMKSRSMSGVTTAALASAGGPAGADASVKLEFSGAERDTASITGGFRRKDSSIGLTVASHHILQSRRSTTRGVAHRTRLPNGGVRDAALILGFGPNAA